VGCLLQRGEGTGLPLERKKQSGLRGKLEREFSAPPSHLPLTRKKKGRGKSRKGSHPKGEGYSESTPVRLQRENGPVFDGEDLVPVNRASLVDEGTSQVGRPPSFAVKGGIKRRVRS